VKLFLEVVDRLIATLPDRFIQMHLQNEMASALEVKAKQKTIREILLRLRPRRWKLRQTQKAEKA
jgi:hypothetical protein